MLSDTDYDVLAFLVLRSQQRNLGRHMTRNVAEHMGWSERELAQAAIHRLVAAGYVRARDTTGRLDRALSITPKGSAWGIVNRPRVAMAICRERVAA